MEEKMDDDQQGNVIPFPKTYGPALQPGNVATTKAVKSIYDDLVDVDPLPVEEEYPIFDSAHPNIPVTLGCSHGIPSHGVRITDQGLAWRWRNKGNAWCGWMFEPLPIVDFHSQIINNYSLEIVYSGNYTGTQSPQVKFLDRKGQATGLVDFSATERIDRKMDRVVRIPLSTFNMDLTIDPQQVTKIQFDAAWNSPEGDIIIKSICFRKNKTVK